MMALGLDISTSCTGWCLLSAKSPEKFDSIDIGAVYLSDIDDVFEKACAVKNCLLGFLDRNITHVFIEENLQSFSRGLSSAQTLVTLARFNGIVSYISQEVLGTPPVFLNVNVARKSLGLKTVKEADSGVTLKEQVFNWVKSDHTRRSLQVEWPQKTLKSGPRKGETVLDRSAYDMSDAYVIAASGIMSIR